MYFEVAESVKIEDKITYEVEAYYLNKLNDYRFERRIPEYVCFETKVEAERIAEALSWAFDWGVEIATEGIKQKIISEVENTLKKF